MKILKVHMFNHNVMKLLENFSYVRFGEGQFYTYPSKYSTSIGAIW